MNKMKCIVDGKYKETDSAIEILSAINSDPSIVITNSRREELENLAASERQKQKELSGGKLFRRGRK